MPDIVFLNASTGESKKALEELDFLNADLVNTEEPF